MIHFLLLFNRQGKVRLQKWYSTYSEKDKKTFIREITSLVFARKPKMSSFIEWKDKKVVYRRYASLYLACAIDAADNELITLEIIHRYVEVLDKYFGNVCELDIIFHFEKAYFLLDEYILAGEVQETGMKEILSVIDSQDIIQEVLQLYSERLLLRALTDPNRHLRLGGRPLTCKRPSKA